MLVELFVARTEHEGRLGQEAEEDATRHATVFASEMKVSQPDPQGTGLSHERRPAFARRVGLFEATDFAEPLCNSTKRPMGTVAAE